MAEFLFFSAFQSIEIEGDLGEGLKLKSNFLGGYQLPDIYLTNDKNIIKKLIDVETQILIGVLESEAIIDSKVTCYAKGEFDENVIDPIECLNGFLTALKTISLSLWLIKDSAVDFEIGFLKYNINNSTHMSSNTYGALNKKSDGSRDTTLFNLEELNSLQKIFLKTEINDTRKSFKNTVIVSNLNRIEVGIYLLQIARREKDLAVRIANYSTCFEALLTNDILEISHKLAERLSYLLSDNPEERIEIYKKAKKIYSVRSSVLHGSKLKEKLQIELLRLSEFSDSTLRNLFFYSYYTHPEDNIFKLSNEDFEEYFLKLIMGIPDINIK